MTFSARAYVDGASFFVISPTTTRHAEASLVGTSSLDGDLIFLLFVTLTGGATVTSSAALDVSAEVEVDGDSNLEATSWINHEVSALVVGDASVGSTLGVDYGIEATVQGDAQVTARALPDDELAIDLRGTSLVAASVEAEYQTTCEIEGSAFTSIVALLRHPFVPPLSTVSKVMTERLVGYQPGREPAVGSETFIIVSDPQKVR